MLPKLYKLIDECCEVKFNKYVCGKDESQLGAFRCGEKVELRLFAPDAKGKKGYVGVLKAADDAGVTLEADGEEIALAYSAIAKANTFFEF